MTSRPTRDHDSAVMALIVCAVLVVFLAVYAWAWQSPRLDPAPSPAPAATP